MGRSKQYRLINSAFILIVCIALSGGLAFASSTGIKLLQHTQVHGFLGQAFIYTDENNFFGQSADGGTFKFTELGVNVSVRPHHRLSIASQLLYRRAGDSATNGLEIDFAVLDYRLFDADRFAMGIRGGRIKNPLGLYNDTRDVVFTRSSVILPQSIYFDRARELALSSDGAQLYGRYQLGGHELSVQAVAAMPRVNDENTELVLLGKDRPGELVKKISWVTRLMVEMYQGKVVFAYTDARLNVGYQPDSTEPSSNQIGSIEFKPKIFSFQFNEVNWQFTFEYARRDFKFDNISYVRAPFDKSTGESYYFQSVYHVNHNWSAFVRYDVLFQDKEDRNGEIYRDQLKALGGNKPAHSRFAKDFTLGLRWYLSREWMVRTELHWINGSAWLPIQDNEGNTDVAQYWKMFAVMAGYRF